MNACLKLDQAEFFHGISLLLILFNSNDLAIWSGFLDIRYITKIMADNRPFLLP